MLTQAHFENDTSSGRMATSDSVTNEAADSLTANGTNQQHLNGSAVEENDDNYQFPPDELYKLALSFYKEKEGKAMQLSYKDKLKLVAYTKQVAHGKYRADISPDVGFLNVVGNDRRLAWQGLGDMSREAAMAEFVQHIEALCPLFKPFLAAQVAEKRDQERRRKEEEERLQREEEERQRQLEEEEIRKKQELQQNQQKQQEAQIRAALNQQTEVQFRQYAEQQYPGNPEQQQFLIAQLQEQHFQQYMQQVYQQQLLHQRQQYNQLQSMQQMPGKDTAQAQQMEQQVIYQMDPSAKEQNNVSFIVGDGTQKHVPSKLLPNGNEGGHEEDDDIDQNDKLAQSMPPLMPASMWTRKTIREFKDNVRKNPENVIKIGSLATATLPPIAAASMWTRKDIKEFKDSIRKDPDSVIKVGSGETVTVRVPTHEDGTCLFWEFATDSYDLGFGVYFEWTIAPSNQVSVHVSESSDEDELEEEEGANGEKGDVEKGAAAKKENRPPTDEIIPVYRRDSHEEVYCGSHMYPGQGVYLLKFDNSYSLWRSKTLYYRVYYTR